ncbi:MAG: hypothetical protein JNK87_04595 [Bryobacterales bacterium]|nr:hypothetical protein [Bryobacterales bacterium]
MKEPMARGPRALVLLLLSVPFCQASVLQYRLNLGPGNTGGGTPAGSFTYNTVTKAFETFDVTFLGLSFDFTSSANAPSVSPTPPACLGGLTGAEGFYTGLTQGCADSRWRYDFGSPTSFFAIAVRLGSSAALAGASTASAPLSSLSNAGGSMGAATLVTAAAPEPALVIPVALVLGLLVARRRTDA